MGGIKRDQVGKYQADVRDDGEKRRKKEMLGRGYGEGIGRTVGNVTCQFSFIVFD